MRAEPKKLRSPTTSLASFTSYISNIGSYVAQNLPDKFVAGTAPRDSAGHDDVGETILFSKFEWVDWNLPLPQLSLPDPERLISPAWYSRRLCLLLGYASGIQVWSLGDLENIREVFSVRGYYESIQNIVALPMPERSTTLSDSFASARPLIAVVAEAKGSSRFEGRAAHFMSLATNQVIFTFRQREREKIKEVKATTRHVLIGTSTSIHVLSAHSLSTLVVINDVFINPATETPSFDIGARFLAYACQGPISTIPRTTAIVDDRSEGGSDDDAVESSVAINAEKIGKAAGKVAKELIGGVKVIGGYGYQALSSYFSGTQPRPTHSGLDASETEASSSGAPRDSEKKSDHRQGYIAVRDLGLLGKSATDDSTLLPPAVACWKAHENPVAIVMFTPSQTRLITVSTHGNNCYIWELPGRPKADRSPHVPHCIYKLERGYTHAVVEDITCSLDGKWVGVSTAKGTTHLYGLESSERKAEGSSSSPSDGALPVYSPPATQARTTTPLYPAARIRQAAPLDKKASLETLPPLPPNPAIDGFGRSASSASQTSLASQKGFYQQQQPASRSFVAETPRGSTTGRSLLIACFGLDEESVFANSARESKVRAESGRHAASKPNGAASHPFEQASSTGRRRS
ncbi:uncharacterized protein BJ171DRAFT_276377 [Polychytrium aggregatum]|uniref:uncharacterized protein n=1 Tax=Polychytrium aggregatum TaxID=110093 RepID=UPI0022FEEC06|nr:uncharacterized protein BJ171DRAFT_276377 [Polychytrium aggregatum]KAI9207488.1 hypothetical protein BJ171DRAFT_276377 [Polychytrium aggregatum]